MSKLLNGERAVILSFPRRTLNTLMWGEDESRPPPLSPAVLSTSPLSGGNGATCPRAFLKGEDLLEGGGRRREE